MAIEAISARPSLRLNRHYAAAPEKVWRAWTDPQALKQWFGPDLKGEVTLAETDVRVGGRYHIVFGLPGAEPHDLSGVYREVVPGRKLAFTFVWKSTPERESLVTITLSPAGGGTDLDLLQEQFFDRDARDRHEGGWNGSFVKLERYLNAGY